MFWFTDVDFGFVFTLVRVVDGFFYEGGPLDRS